MNQQPWYLRVNTLPFLFVTKLTRISYERVQQCIWIIKQDRAALLKATVNTLLSVIYFQFIISKEYAPWFFYECSFASRINWYLFHSPKRNVIGGISGD